MLHPDTQLRFIDPDIGYGVFATQPIPKGTITWTIDELDRRFAPADVQSFTEVFRELIDKYTYRDRYGQFIMAWDHGRCINHAADPNSLMTAYEFEIAVRDILPGEELTDDYGCLNVTRPLRCARGSNGRDVVLPDDLLRYHRMWDEKLREAFSVFASVPQPLRRYLQPEIGRRADLVASGATPMESILTCYFRDETLTAGSQS